MKSRHEELKERARLLLENARREALKKQMSTDSTPSSVEAQSPNSNKNLTEVSSSKDDIDDIIGNCGISSADGDT